MSEAIATKKYVRRTIRLTCENGHQWTAERIAEIVGSVKIVGGDSVPVMQHVSLAPKSCAKCGSDAEHYEPLTDYAPQ